LLGRDRDAGPDEVDLLWTEPQARGQGAHRGGRVARQGVEALDRGAQRALDLGDERFVCPLAAEGGAHGRQVDPLERQLEDLATATHGHDCSPRGSRKARGRRISSPLRERRENDFRK
jgi:hypothetical protein